MMQKPTRTLSSILLLLGLGLGLLIGTAGCSKKTDAESLARQGLAEDLAGKKIILANYLAAKPGRIISSQAPLEIEFSRSMVPPELVDGLLSAQAFQFKPNVEGEAHWLTQSLVRFVPTKPLAAGASYQLEFVGKAAFGAGVDVDNLTMAFQVIPQEILSVEGDFGPAPGLVNMARLELTLRFSQVVNLDKLKGDLKLKAGLFSSLQYALSPIGDGRQVKLVSSPMERTDDPKTILLSIDGEWSATGKDFTQEFLLAAKGSFVVVSHGELPDARSGFKTWGIRFSDPLPGDQDWSAFVTLEPAVGFKVMVQGRNLRIQGDFQAGIQYRITLRAGLPSAYGIKLTQPWLGTMTFENEKPRVEWLSAGVFLPLENKMRLQLQSVNLAKAHIKVFEVPPQNLVFFLQRNKLEAVGSGSYDDEYGNYCEGFCEVERVSKPIFEDSLSFAAASRNRWFRSELDLSKLTQGKPGSVFLVELTFGKNDLPARCTNSPDDASPGDLLYTDDSYSGNPCGGSDEYYSGYYNEAAKRRIIVLSSLGLTVKKSTSGLDVWASDVAQAEGVSGLELKLYSYNNEVLESQTTNGEGHAHFKNAKGFALVGRNERGLALLRLDQPSWELSRFDAGGASAGTDGLRAFIYADRGVHRPGDTIHLSCMVRAARKAPEEGTPLILKVSNSRGQAAFEAKGKTNDQGMASFDIPTRSEDQTGTWSAHLQVGGQVFSQALRVEMVKPNRLKVMAQIPEVVQGKKRSFEANYEVRYLFGMPAAGSEISITTLIQASPMLFPRYPDFNFNDPNRQFQDQSNEVFKGNLDAEGKVKMNIEIPDLSSVPEAASMTLQTRVSEQGGEWTEQWQTLRIEPYDAWVGIDKHFTERWVRLRDTLRIPVVALNAKGRPIDGRKLKIRFYSNRRYWWWHYDEDGKKDFRTQSETFLAGEQSISSGDRPKTVVWVPEDQGTVLMEVVDEAGGHVAGMSFFVSEWSDGMGNQNKNREEAWLDVQLDKPMASIGDSLYASFSSAAGARALVTVEQAGKVLESRWVKTESGKTRVGFELSEAMIPNAYVSVSLQQPQDRVKNDQPLRLYGVKNMMVEDQASRLPVQMTVPSELKPDMNFEILVKNSGNNDASFTLAVVDEGLLDLTHFETPDPWKFYFQKLALDMETMDNYEQVVGALLPNMDALFSLGGDYELMKRRKNPKARRFPVVALFSGVRDVQAGKTETVRFKMPHYVGSVRAMLVGSTEKAFASREKAIPVRQALMALPTLPRVVRTGDRFHFPVAVFAMDPQVKNVQVKLVQADGLRVIRGAEQSVHFDKPGEADVMFELEATTLKDAAHITVEVSSGQWKTTERVALPVVAPAPYSSQVRDTMLPAGSAWSWQSGTSFLPGSERTRLVLSRMPSLPVEAMLRNLDAYPFGCLEQTVSGAFPLLYFNSSATSKIQSAIERLRSFQAPGKGFTLWPQGPNQYNPMADPWATSWTGLFLLEAKAKGFSVSQPLMDHWLNFENSQVGKAPTGDYRNQALRLFLLARAGKAATGAMNLLRESYGSMLDPLSARLLAAAYSLQGQADVAEQVLGGQLGARSVHNNGAALPSAPRELSGTYGSSLRDLALMTYAAAYTKDTLGAKRLLSELVKAWSQDSWHSTQEIATALLAYASLSQNMPSGSDVEYEVELPGQAPRSERSTGQPKVIDLSGIAAGSVKVRAKSGLLFLRIEEGGIPQAATLGAEHAGLTLDRNFFTDAGSAITLEQTEPGQPFWVVYRVKSLIPRRLDGLALSSLFPSGWEIINPRLRDDLPKWLAEKKSPRVEYMDIRDDRVDWFFSLAPTESAEFFIRVIPTFEGDYIMPAVGVEAMYSPEFHARLQSDRVIIKGE